MNVLRNGIHVDTEDCIDGNQMKAIFFALFFHSEPVTEVYDCRPDLGQRALPQTPPSSGAPTPRSSETSDVVRRQTSVTDGEAIKIVIHDVDSDTGFSK